MIATEATAFQNQPFASALRLARPNGQGPFPLTSSYLVRLWRYVNGVPTMFVSAAPTSITADANFTIVQYAFTAPQMNVAEGYGTIELYDNTAGQTVMSAALRIVPTGTVYQPEFALPLVLYAETITCIVDVFYTLNAVADNGITNSKLTDMASGTVKARVSAGAGDPEDATFPQLITAMGLRKGQNALNLVPASLLGRKAIIMDFVGGGYASIDDAGDVYSAIESITGLTLTNSTGGKITTRKKLMANTAANSFRYHHQPDGTPGGILVEAGFSYLNKKTNPLIADLDFATAITNTSAPSGWPANAIAVGDATASRFAGYNLSVTSGSDYFGSFLVVMTDASAPAPCTAIGGAGDFSLYGPGGLISKHPDTGAAGARVSGPFAGNVYLVEGYWTAAATATTAVGIDKRSGNSAKTFNVFHFQFGAGRYPPSLFDNATVTPNARSADAAKLSVSGYTFDHVTVCGEFVMPRGATDNYICQLFGSAGSRFVVTAVSASQVNLIYVDGSLNPVVALTGLTVGQKYRFAGVIDLAAKKMRGKAQGIAAPSDTAFNSTIGVAPVSLSIGSYDAASNYLNGSVSVVAVVDRAWTTAEIAQWVG